MAENVSVGEVWGWNVIRYHNKLAYLKDKGKFEIALNKIGNSRRDS